MCCLCVSNNYECVHNPTFYIIKKENQDMFDNVIIF